VFDRQSLSRAIEFVEKRDMCLYREGGSRLRFDRGMARGIGICCLLISRVALATSIAQKSNLTTKTQQIKKRNR
jgi:hypothetical protein